LVREARARAGLTQRELAQLASVPQASIARIEGGAIIPRFDTLQRLLLACGVELKAVARADGVDRSLIRARLAMTPWARHQAGIAAARALLAMRAAPMRPAARR
jgi:transcriptional regulator with XRE-family HTH domain